MEIGRNKIRCEQIVEKESKQCDFAFPLSG